MKKISLILYSVAVMGMLSCGGNGNGSVKDADSVEIEVETPAVATTWNLTEKGIGDVTLGMDVAEIPDSVAGLCDHVEKYEGKDFVGYSFTLNNVETFQAQDTDFDGKVNLIAVQGESKLKATTGNGPVYIGMPEADLLKPEGDTLVTKDVDGSYHVGKFRIQTQDGKVSGIYIEWAPTEK